MLSLDDVFGKVIERRWLRLHAYQFTLINTVVDGLDKAVNWLDEEIGGLQAIHHFHTLITAH